MQMSPTRFPQATPVIHIVPLLTAQFTLAITLPMTTVQETSNGHRVSPPPCHDATGTVSAIYLPARRLTKPIGSEGSLLNPCLPAASSPFPMVASAPWPAPTFIPPSVPFTPNERQQLFGRPAPGGNVVGAAFDLPELYSACRDLTTAAGVNRALAQVFRLLAQRRISRQEAATFGHLAQLLLRTITLARAESVAAPAAGARANATSPVIRSEQRERRIPPEPAPDRDTSPPSSPVCEPVPSRQQKNGASAPPDSLCNSSEINTYKNAELKAVQNEHFREIPGAGAARDTKTEILPTQPLSVLHQEPPEPQEPQGPQPGSNTMADLKTWKARACG